MAPARREAVQPVDHAAKVEAARLRVVVRIVAHGESRRLEELPVVFPARVADPDFGRRRDLPQEIRADLQAAGAAECLHGDDALFLDEPRVLAEYELLHGAVVGG